MTQTADPTYDATQTGDSAGNATLSPRDAFGGLRVAVIIPALNEAPALPHVLAAIPSGVAMVIVADNGSTDGTGNVARKHGAVVVREPVRGYGRACLAALAHLEDGATSGVHAAVDVVVFLDGDASDRPDEMLRLVAPIADGSADLVIGSRTLGQREAGALTPQQVFGNWLACTLIRLIWGVRFTDLGPFRAIRASALRDLAMADTDYGWTVEMQVKAARAGLRTAEMPAGYRKRIGKSKVSGTIRGVFGAGTKILYVIGREAVFGPRVNANSAAVTGSSGAPDRPRTEKRPGT